MSFTAPKFTNAGRQLQTRVIAGDTLTFTTIKLGDGTMTTEPIAALTDLIHGIITLPVHEVRRNADYAEVTGDFPECWIIERVFTGERSEFLQLIRIIRTTAVTISCTATRTQPSWRSIFRLRPLR